MRYSEQLHGIDELLVLATRADRTASDDERLHALSERYGNARCLDAARRNNVDAIVAKALADVGCSGPWSAIADTNASRVRSLMAHLERVCGRLHSAGCAAATIEGGAVMLMSALDEAAYGASDFDLIVAAHRDADVPDLLASEGFFLADKRGRATIRREYCNDVAGPQPLWLEVGTAAFDRMWVPLGVIDLSQHWLQRAVPTKKLPSVRAFDPTDLLVQVAIHTSLHSYVRKPGLRLHLDVDRVVRDNPIDWQEFCAQVSASHARIRVFVALVMAAGLLGTPIPESILQELAPSMRRWRAIHALLQREGTLDRGRPKLRALPALLLDILIDDAQGALWVKRFVLPDPRWLRRQFGQASPDAAAWRLHIRRYNRLLRGWHAE